jgi:hypothetical protein
MGQPKENMKCIHCGAAHDAVYFKDVAHIACYNKECTDTAIKEIQLLVKETGNKYHTLTSPTFSYFILPS